MKRGQISLNSREKASRMIQSLKKSSPRERQDFLKFFEDARISGAWRRFNSIPVEQYWEELQPRLRRALKE